MDSWCCKSPLGLLLYAFRAAVFEPAFVLQGKEEPLHEKRKRLKKWRMANIQTTRTALRQKLTLSAKYIYKDRMWPDGRRHQIGISGCCYSSHWLPGFHSNISFSKWKQKNCRDFLILQKDLKSWMIWKLENYDGPVTSWEWTKESCQTIY